MARDWIDAEFEIVGPLRLSDPHPDHKDWRFAGVDLYGRTLWRKPPLIARWQLFLLLLLAIPLARGAIYLIAEHHWLP